MDRNQSDPTEQILNLTLEIVFLLTREDYFVVKKPGGKATNNSLQVVEGTWRERTDIHLPLRQSVIHEPHNKQRILDLTNKILELLSGEVPIRCQDVAVYFSMEEWEYLEGHKDLYDDIIMENHRPLTSPGLRKGGADQYPTMQSKEEGYGGNSTNPNISTFTDDIQEDPPTQIKEEPASYGGGNLTDKIIHTRQGASPSIKEEPASCDGGNVIDPKYTPLDDKLEYRPSHIKDEPVVEEGETLTNPNVYAIRDHTQQCISHVHEEPAPSGGGNLTDRNMYIPTNHTLQCPSPLIKEGPAPCGGGNLICDAQRYPSTPVQEGTNPPETQSRPNDNINVQFSLVPHQEIHVTERFLQSATHILTTTIVHAPQEPPVKHKLLTCSKCGRAFYTKSSLVVHMKTHWNKIDHLQNESFKCRQCGKCFLSQTLLNMHSRLHFGDRPYACCVCGERFIRTNDLGRHKKQKHL